MTQAEALDILKTGANAYITGPAGSGKTHLLNQYIAFLKRHDVDVGITASTGIAATHMGGVTIHSWSGLGVKDTLTDYDIESLHEKEYLWKRFNRVKVLIIDEVSMLHHFRLDLVDAILRSFKRNEKPFGGIQVILCGDFFQLPPVARPGEPDAYFVYHSEAWKKADFKICYLEEQFRQKDDHALKVLNAIRGNVLDDSIRAHLDACFEERELDIEPTRLYTHNIDVDQVNDRELATIESTVAHYDMTSRGNEVLVSLLKKSCLAPEFLKLKTGARVMCVKNNFEAGYVNGSLGVVTSLGAHGEGPTIRLSNGKLITMEPASWTIEEDGKIKAEIRQYPLRLAWAITIHKSQGMSLDAVEVDLSKSFERGMGYVALSRVRSLKGLKILGINDEALRVHDEVLEYDEELRERSNKATHELSELRKKGVLRNLQETFLHSIVPPEGKKATPKIHTNDQTRALLAEKLSLDQLAKKRGVTVETILNHLEKITDESPEALSEIEYLRKEVSPKVFGKIYDELVSVNKKFGDWRLAPVKNKLGSKVTYRDIQLVRVFAKAEGK